MSGATARPNTIQVPRRARALPLNAALWILLCAIVVIVAHSLAAGYGFAPSEYWSGSISLLVFVMLGWYSIRKRTLWFSMRVLRTTARFLPPALQQRMIVLDRLESWRAVHITLGILVALPLWWHMSAGLMSFEEILLALVVALLLLSGLVGVAIQDLLPIAIQAMSEHEVRLEDVTARIDVVYVEAEEMVLGHQEALVQAYIKHLKPILEADRTASRSRLLLATLTKRNPGAEICAGFRAMAPQFGDEAPVWNALVDLAARKINLEHNVFNLHFSTDWLSLHIALALCTFGLLMFHIVSVLYFKGL